MEQHGFFFVGKFDYSSNSVLPFSKKLGLIKQDILEFSSVNDQVEIGFLWFL